MRPFRVVDDLHGPARGAQCTGRERCQWRARTGGRRWPPSTRAFFADLGIVQSFSRPRTPTDNATAESWMATLKCGRLYDADTAELSPDEMCSMVDRFIDYNNNVRLSQGLGYVTPAERHEGRHVAIIAARRRGLGGGPMLVRNRWSLPREKRQ